ncbi:hypothetical protein CICLE_v10019529mg [Citrus x clementina]|uniref:Growth-regulating factor n=1 Tax=Citrus clementina TaxID=85681 RepID=V4TM14_CITCL|nr:growth-regulating factor 2 isoform X2 [Citrus x clementina]XP_006493185.2 growth-regulating factor 2 [Citrus sinensis]ESR54457.1 hypothetical protein CICLE_v10019529mg [Citrus x clementina]
MMSGRIMDACDFSFINEAAAEEGKVKEAGSNRHRPSPSDEFGWGDAVAGGPTCNNNINNSSSSNHIYKTIGYVSSDSSGSSTSMKTLQPFQFDIAAATVNESPGMAARMGFPFTNAQWTELERQALIYKCMVASVPVPSDLLFPFTRNRNSAAAAAAPVGLDLIRLSKGGDLEPGRCRRTDGKKWRCSRDVAPDQKYCERHLHRGRPRSRKPVELQPPPNSKKKTRLQSHPLNTTNTVNNSNNNNLDFSASQFVRNFTQYPHPHVREQRCLDKDWMMRGEAVHLPSNAAGTEWNHLINNPASPVNINQHYHLEEPLNLNSFASFSAGEAQQSNDCPFYTDPDLVPRVFIDAWSNANGVSNGDDQIHNTNSGTKSSVSSSGNLSLSPLSLSMGGNSTIDEEMGQLQMGLGLVESSQDHKCDTNPQLSSWLNPDSWAPGGPLAEVLRPSTVPASASGPPSPAAGNGDSDSPPATTVSSPSGVLQKALVSWSDSSGNSSPTPGSSRTNKSEIALLWFGQGKLES